VSDLKVERQEPDELDLEAESVRDLDVDEETARELRGGSLLIASGSADPGNGLTRRVG
jgi:hypothetical protein